MITEDIKRAAVPGSSGSPSLNERKIYAMTRLMDAERLSDADDFKAALAAYRDGMSERGLPVQTLMSAYLFALNTYVQSTFDIDEIYEFCEFINSRADDIIKFCGPFCISQICDKIIDFKIQTKTKIFHDKLYAHCESIYDDYIERKWESDPERKDEKGLILKHIKLLHLAIVLERTGADASAGDDESAKSNPPISISLKRLRDYASLYEDYHDWKDDEEERTCRRADDSLYNGIGKWCEPAATILKGLREPPYEDRLFSAFLNMCVNQRIKAAGPTADQQYRRATGLFRKLLETCCGDERFGVNATDINTVRRDIITCIYKRLELLEDKGGEKAAEFAQGIIRESRSIDFDKKVDLSDGQIITISDYLYKAAELCTAPDVSDSLFRECLRVLDMRDHIKYPGNVFTQARLLHRKAMCLRATGDATGFKQYIDEAVRKIDTVKDVGNKDLNKARREYRQLQLLASGSDSDVKKLIDLIAGNHEYVVTFHTKAMELKRHYADKGGFAIATDTMEKVVRIYIEHFDRICLDELIDGIDTRNVTGLDVILKNALYDLDTIKRIPYSRDILLSRHPFIRNNRESLLKQLEHFKDDIECRQNFIGMLRSGWNFGTPDRMDSLLEQMLNERDKNHILDISHKKLSELLEILSKSYLEEKKHDFALSYLYVVRDAIVEKTDIYLGKADMILADMYLAAEQPLKALEAVNRAIDARPYVSYRMKRSVILDAVKDENVTQIYNRDEFIGNIFDDEEEDEVYDEATVEQFFLTFSLLDWQKYGDNRLLNDRINLKGTPGLKQSFAKAKAKAEKRNKERHDQIIGEESAKGLFLQWIPEIDDDLIGRRISKFYEKRRNADGSTDNRLYKLCDDMVKLLDSTDLDDNLVRGFTDIVIRTLERAIRLSYVNRSVKCRIRYVLAFCYHRIGMPSHALIHIQGACDGHISEMAKKNLGILSNRIRNEEKKDKPTAVRRDHKNNPLAYQDIFRRFNSNSALKYIYHDWTMDGFRITDYDRSRQEFFKEADIEAENMKNNTLLREGFVDMLTDYINGTEGWFDWCGEHHKHTLRDFREDKRFVLRQNANNGLSPESLRDSVRMTSPDNLRELFEYAREQAVREYFTNGDRHADQYIIFDDRIGNAVDFYCDKRAMSDALTQIFKDMLQLYKGKKLTIEIAHRKEKSPDGGSSEIVTLTQRDATTSRTCKNFSAKLSKGGGNFSVVREILRNVCDWSVETRWIDGPRRVNCLSAYEVLTVDASDDIASLTDDRNIFRHIFRIYNI